MKPYHGLHDTVPKVMVSYQVVLPFCITNQYRVLILLNYYAYFAEHFQLIIPYNNVFVL